MKLAPSGVGAEPKKLALLAAVLLVGGGVYWNLNRTDTTAVSANVSPNVTQAPAPVAAPARPLSKNDDSKPDPELAAIQRRGSIGAANANSGDTWIPTMKLKEDMDVSKIDPRLRLDLLTKVRAVPLEGGSSSLFEFSKAPEPPAPLVAAINPVVPVPLPAPKPPASVTATKPGPPPAPPIPFKYYGYDKTADGRMEAWFLEGDPNTGNIYYKREGDMVKDRYKVVRIGLRSAIVEDTITHNQQTLALLEELP